MRPENCRRIINKEMRKFYNSNVTDLPDLSIMYCFKKPEVYKALKHLEKKTERMEREFYEGREITDMYPDVTSVEDILGGMFYVSDRWCCAGRIKFVLRVVDNLDS